MTLQLHNLRPAKGAKTYRKRLGRGNASGKGTTGGRGGKGQTARTGGRAKLKYIGMRHLILATPKLRGFQSMYKKDAVVTLDQLAVVFSANQSVNPKTLKQKGLIAGSAVGAKILGTGNIKKRIVVSGCAVTEGAKQKIVAAGGEIR
jgi:large subunit ribosomal protein L15